MSVRAVAIGAAAGALLLAGVLVERHWYGAAQYKAGAAAKLTEIEKRQAAIERGWQEERDRADVEYRGAVLARQAAEKDLAAERGRIDGLLRQLAQQRAAAASSGGRPDAAGPDWIGIFGQCVAEYESMGREAGRLADQVNGLRGYINALRRWEPAGGVSE